MKFIILIASSTKSKIVSFTSSRIKNIVVFLVHFKFPVKLIFCIAFRSASRACCLLKSIAVDFL